MPEKEVRLVRIHLEEDVAKSFHFESSTGIDFNRAGTPLMEIVTEPEINSPEEAFAFLSALKQILIYGGVSDADMEKGQLRCDCNISLRPEGQPELGAKIEIKNMNSISGVRRALAYEVERQSAALERGRDSSSRKRGAGTMMPARRSSCAQRRWRTIIATFPIPICFRCGANVCSKKCARACRNCRRQNGPASSRNTRSVLTTPACWRATSSWRAISKAPPQGARKREERGQLDPERSAQRPNEQLD